MERRIEGLSVFVILYFKWGKALKFYELIETGETVTENPSGYKFSTISISMMCYKLLMKRCMKVIHSDNVTFKKISENMI